MLRPPAVAVRPLSGGLPGDRLPSLRRALEDRPCLEGTSSPRPLRILETHSGLTGLIADRIACPTTHRSYDGMWSSSLTASAVRAMPDIEAVDVTARLDTVRETLAVTTKPIIYDADTGGEPDVLRYTVRALEQLGVSAAVVEDKAGLKQNSLFGTERAQTLASVENFTAKIRAGVDARRHPDFMIVARMESLIAGAGMDEAIRRAVASTDAGADGILIHSRASCPGEIREFAWRYREFMGDSTSSLPIMAVPTTYNAATEKELAECGIDVCIYANHMLRAAYPAMVRAAGSILRNSRSYEAENAENGWGGLLSVKDIIRLIDDKDVEGGAGTADMAALAFGFGGHGATPRAKGGYQNPRLGSANIDRTRMPPKSSSFLIPPSPVNKLNGENGDGPAKKGMGVMPSMARSESTLAVSDALAKEEEAGSSTMRPGGVDPVRIINFLRSDLGVDFFVGVPDSCLKYFCAEIDGFVGDDAKAAKHVIAANEGASVAMAVGHHLARGNVPLVYMQNSGLGNAVNPLLSAAHPEVYGIPMVMLIGWRGCPDGDPDEPQHRVAGRQMLELLNAAGVETLVLPEDDGGAEVVLREAFKTARARAGPVAVLVKPKTFTKGKGASSSTSPSEEFLPTREETISTILDSVGPADVIVSTTGFTSRELYELRESRGDVHDADFLCVGSMGHAAAIAQGIAMERPDRTVWCLDGDGAALMHLGSLVSSPSLGLPNFRHVLINNRVHESVGGQGTSVSQNLYGEEKGGAAPDAFDFADLARVSGYASAEVVRSLRSLSLQLDRIHSATGPAFIEVKVKMGAREGLGRPKHSTLDARQCFRAFMDAPAKAGGAEEAEKKRPVQPGGGLLLTPGPLTTSKQTKLAMMQDYGSRDRQFVELTANVRRDLLDVLPGENSDLTAVLLQGSGTFAVEAMLAQFVPRDASTGVLLIFSNGAYGRRMAAICEANGLPHILHESPENAPLDPVGVESVLNASDQEDIVTHVAVVHCETTTGVLNPLPEISRVVASSGKKLLIDAMSAFGIAELPSSVTFEALAASSSKGLQGPPGVGFVVCSRAGLEECAGNATTLSLDLHAQWRTFETGGEWRFTPPTHVMLGLSKALEEFKEEGGVEGRAARCAINCDILVTGMRRFGFETLLADEVQAPVIVTFLLPSDSNFEFKKFYNLLSHRGFVIYPGKVAKTPTFRVGCIGDVHPRDMRRFLVVVRETMDEMGVESGNPKKCQHNIAN